MLVHVSARQLQVTCTSVSSQVRKSKKIQLVEGREKGDEREENKGRETERSKQRGGRQREGNRVGRKEQGRELLRHCKLTKQMNLVYVY